MTINRTDQINSTLQSTASFSNIASDCFSHIMRYVTNDPCDFLCHSIFQISKVFANRRLKIFQSCSKTLSNTVTDMSTLIIKLHANNLLKTEILSTLVGKQGDVTTFLELISIKLTVEQIESIVAIFPKIQKLTLQIDLNNNPYPLCSSEVQNCVSRYLRVKLPFTYFYYKYGANEFCCTAPCFFLSKKNYNPSVQLQTFIDKTCEEIDAQNALYKASQSHSLEESEPEECFSENLPSEV